MWDPAAREYGWMTGDYATLRRRYSAEDLAKEAAPLGLTATVAVQAATAKDETVELLALADDPRSLVAGVVGWVDLTAPDVAERIAELRAQPGGARLAGIRHPVHDEPDIEWLLRPEVLAGLRAVAATGLCYDLLLSVRCTCRSPPTSHGSCPSCGLYSTTAPSPRSRRKLSGLVTEADWHNWRPGELRRYANRLLELFGPRRLMFGSDWPVCTLASSYGEVLELALETTVALSEGEREAVMAGTAVAVYGLAGLVPPDASVG